MKDGTTGDNCKKIDGHIMMKILTCKKIWNKFNMKHMGDYLFVKKINWSEIVLITSSTILLSYENYFADFDN